MERLGDECDRIVFDWYDKLKEVEVGRDEARGNLDKLIEALAKDLLPSVSKRLESEVSRTKELDDLKAEIKENSYRSPGDCSDCGNPLVPMWVCEGVEAPECEGHDGDGDV